MTEISSFLRFKCNICSAGYTSIYIFLPGEKYEICAPQVCHWCYCVPTLFKKRKKHVLDGKIMYQQSNKQKKQLVNLYII